MSNESQDSQPKPPPNQFGSDIYQADHDNIELALRFLFGLFVIGGDEAARRLQEMQQKLNENPSQWSDENPDGEPSLHRQFWHMGVGLFLRGHRRVRKELRRGIDRTLGVADRISSTSAEWRSSYLPKSVREALEARLDQWQKEANALIKVGELEEQKARAFAKGALAELVTEIMDELAQNPDLQEFVQDLVSQQGVGMATSAVDNARSVTVTADDAAEGLLRWLLRRAPRRELPPSPVEGQPQTMYAPKVRIEGRIDDNGEI